MGTGICAILFYLGPSVIKHQRVRCNNIPNQIQTPLFVHLILFKINMDLVQKTLTGL